MAAPGPFAGSGVGLISTGTERQTRDAVVGGTSTAAHFRVGLDLGVDVGVGGVDGYSDLDIAYRQSHPGAFGPQLGFQGHRQLHRHLTKQQQQQQHLHGIEIGPSGTHATEGVVGLGPGSLQQHNQHNQHNQQQETQRAGQFGVLTPTPAPAVAPDVTDGRLQSYKVGGKLVADPPDLQAWRERLFDVDDMIILTHEQFDTYFPHVDNVYSHRSTQRYKRKPFVSHYWDCRMKGRPPGTPKSDDPAKKKRKRNARERDLCDVKIKITEYFAGADDAAALDCEVAAALAAAAAGAGFGVLPAPGERFWTIQRVNGNGGNGKGDGVAGPHKHTLAKSDEIKKNSVQRHVAKQGKGVKKTQDASHTKATGAAQLTVRKRAEENDLKLFAACFCPFSQRVWIALEAKGLAYQYVETDPMQRPALMPLLEANPRGRVPVIQQGGWACAESAVILEYLEDVYTAVPLLPSDPRLKANCRLWIDHINTHIITEFFALLRPPHKDQHGNLQHHTVVMERLQSHLTSLILAADEQGPFFLGPSFSLVDIHFAPFALRLGRVLRHRCGWVDPVPGTRWYRWLDALEQNPNVYATTSLDDLYIETTDAISAPDTSTELASINHMQRQSIQGGLPGVSVVHLG